MNELLCIATKYGFKPSGADPLKEVFGTWYILFKSDFQNVFEL
jgi:hypothetical protein